ncbi:Beta-glucosidase [Acidisarcina polymorpha]|uniref:Beta-glucosidase n=1 Tax=Acidisarcina polymorpha TaxID=2211140 RepID=A0A2Z5FWR8_9BACT|nr:beta-glucosidase [Acidisarcina polymorpha]AXC11339.1 Beta-glucosidase [Acidisarcina polymorpha]
MRISPLVKQFIAIGFGFSIGALAQSSLPYQNPSLPTEQRVNDLVSRMTLEEKVSQMQNHAAAIPRLGVPAYDWWSEALHGVARSGYATVFPQAIGMAATWDTDLIHHEAEIISTEARAKYGDAIAHGNHDIYYGLDFWSPNINIFRDPRWGRGQETYGEDPYLTSRLGVAFVESMQGNDPKYFKVIATPKHFAVHSGPESLRHKFNVNVSPYDLEDTYLPAFRATITEAHADSIMCAYNAIDGAPACANTMLLQEHLRKAWNFQGYVTSDCGAVGDISEGHKYATDLTGASVAAVKAGTDTTCGPEYPTLVQAVKDHKISEQEIDTAVKRLFTARFRLGMFDPQESVPYSKIGFSENNTAEHRKAALEAAEKSIVLLKNDTRILPLASETGTIAVIGPNAANLASIEGNYNGVPSAPVVPLKGIEDHFAGKSKVVYSQGSAFTVELPLVVPRTVFHPSAGSSEVGLKGEYFSSGDLSGTPVVTRVDPNLDFDWQSASPVAGLSSTLYSVRWTAMIQAPGAGDYKFGFRDADCYPCTEEDRIRVFVDDRQVVDGGRKGNTSGANSFSVHFEQNQSHAIRIEYAHQGQERGGGIRMEWEPDAAALREQAVAVAKQADVVLAFVGLSPDLEGEEMPVHVEGFSGGDRTDIALPAVQRQLLEALNATGKPLVVVLMNGSALAVDWAKEHAAAILEAWYPGEEGGTAIAETLAGTNNPAGRLPVTFYPSVEDLPAFDEYSMKNRTYRYYKGRVLYPFGYGLSYTSFSYGELKITPTEAKANGPVQVSVTVSNSGNVKGDEVVQLYLTAPGASAVRALKGFKRVSLEPGASKQVDFALDARDLSRVREDGSRAVMPGKYTLSVGGSQPDGSAKVLEGGFSIHGTQVLPK